MLLIARRPRGGTVGYWLKSLLGSLLNPMLTVTEDRDAAVVIARTRLGREHILLRTGTYGQATRARTRFQRELDALGETEFCRRYGLPETNEANR
jgi:hypothetical protein